MKICRPMRRTRGQRRYVGGSSLFLQKKRSHLYGSSRLMSKPPAAVLPLIARSGTPRNSSLSGPVFPPGPPERKKPASEKAGVCKTADSRGGLLSAAAAVFAAVMRQYGTKQEFTATASCLPVKRSCVTVASRRRFIWIQRIFYTA